MITIKEKGFPVYLHIHIRHGIVLRLENKLSEKESYAITESLFQNHTIKQHSFALESVSDLLNDGFDICGLELKDIEDYDLDQYNYDLGRFVIIEPLLEWAKEYVNCLTIDFANAPISSSDIAEARHAIQMESYGTSSIEKLKELPAIITDILERIHDTLI